MKLEFRASFDTLPEMLDFSTKVAGNSAETNTNHDALFERIQTMANEQVAAVISSMQTGFATLNEAQARSTAAVDRLMGMVNDMPARIQAAVDAAVANGVDEGQIAALTSLQAAVAGEVAEAQAEATRLESAAPAPAPVPAPPAPVDGAPPADEVPPTDGGVVPPVSGDVPPGDAGSDTTGGGAPVPTPGA